MNESESGLPCDTRAEGVILGAILLNNENFFDDSVDLNANDFCLDSNQRIYSAMNDILFGMIKGVTVVDIVTLSNELSRRKEIRKVGGVSYLASLTEGLPLRPEIAEYVRIVKDKARLRRLMRIFSAGLAMAQDQSQSAGNIAAAIQEHLTEEGAEGPDSAVSIGDVTPSVEFRVKTKRIVSTEKTALEMTWGLSGLDTFTRGAFGGELTIISGESGGGKTMFAVQMTLANAREGIPCAWMSLEMPKEKIVSRYYPLISETITAQHMRDPRLMNLHTHVPEMEKISKELIKLPIMIDDTSPMRIDRMIARMKMLRRKHGTRLFVIDYLQLLEGLPGRNEVEQFKKTVFMLRDFPKSEPDCHLAVLSQYSQSDGFVKKKRRSKRDLYGGSVIHHAAQNVLMIAIEDADEKEDNELLDVEFTFAKQRDGKVGKVKCMLDRDHHHYTYPQPPLRGV